MSTEDNKRVIRRWLEAWNTNDLDAAEGLLQDDYVRHDANLPDIVGPQAERQFVATALAAFPDLRFEAQHLVAEDDLVMGRLRVQGTHRGEFMGVPASGRRLDIQTVETFRLLDGKIAEQWVVMNVLGLLQQLGASPRDPVKAPLPLLGEGLNQESPASCSTGPAVPR
jgi:steroid delta-isomerase-like uncharacterized protein